VLNRRSLSESYVAGCSVAIARRETALSPALRLDPGLTVITGPNGVGKSNLARSLDVARAVLAPHDHPESGRLDLYREAGFEGATEFTVKLDMVLDQPWEQDLVRTYVQAAYLASGPRQSPQAADSFEKSVDWLVPDSLTPVMAGALVIRYRVTAARPWGCVLGGLRRGQRCHMACRAR